MPARRASYDKKTLARQVIPLAPGYRTALLSRPVKGGNFERFQTPTTKIQVGAAPINNYF